MSTRYVHYGHSKYDRDKVCYAKNQLIPVRCKPAFGLWASREDSRYGWIDWCRNQADPDSGEEFGFGNFESSFEFELSPQSKIFEIHSEEDILPYIIRNSILGEDSFNLTSIVDGIDFNKMMDDGYDGVELFLSDDFSMHNGIFNLWDCDSIVVWNPDIINTL